MADIVPQDEEAVSPGIDDLDGPTEKELRLIELELERDDFWKEDDRFISGLDLDDYDFETDE